MIILDYYYGEIISAGDLRRNLAFSVDEHDWPEEKERLKSWNLEEGADRHSHGRIDSLSSGLVPLPGQKYPSKSVFTVGYCFGGKHALRLSPWTVKGALVFRPVSLALPSGR